MLEAGLTTLALILLYPTMVLGLKLVFYTLFGDKT